MALLADILLIVAGFAISELKDYFFRKRERRAQEKARQALLVEAETFYESMRRKKGEKLSFQEAKEEESRLGGETALWVFHPRQREVILAAGAVIAIAFDKKIVRAIDGEWAIYRYFFDDADDRVLDTEEKAALELMSRMARLGGFWRNKRHVFGYVQHKIQEASFCFGERYIPCSEEKLYSTANEISLMKDREDDES